MTVQSILQVCKSQGTYDPKHTHYKMYFKDGADGAGQQVVWKSKSMKNSKQNMFQYGLTALRLSCMNKDNSETTIWENSVPNSARSLRPVYLIQESETDADLLKLVIPSTDVARDKLNAEGNDIDISVSIIDSMKDLKFKKSISGLGGADCILCYTKRGDWTNRDKILQGFPIQRNSTDTFDLYQELTEEESHELERKSGDFDTRKGLTKKPLTTSSQMSITITHSYINGTTWFLKLLYRCHIDWKNWVQPGTGDLGTPLEHSRDRVLYMIEESTGLVLDQCNTAGGKGGTTTNGPQGRRFYSEETINVIERLSDQRYTKQILILHRQISMILRVISCCQKINLTKFQELCKDTSLNIAENFPWAVLNDTLHGAIHHSAELIEYNSGYGLGSLSEECLESNNKDVRNYLQFLARKCSPGDQLADVLCRLLERSDPVIQEQMRLKRPKKSCTACNGKDHTIRSHARKLSLPKYEYDTYMDEMLLV